MTVDPLAVIVGRTYATLKTVLPAAERVAVVDYPAHQNFGDSLLYLGQEKYLDKLGYQVSYIGDVHRYSADFLRRRHPTGPIFLHGGGSLGDRYQEIQSFREQLISDFPDRPIVQFPQSMDFSSPKAAARARAVFSAHPDLTLLLRDQVSLEKARQAFPDTRTEYCPDVAFGNGWLPTPGPVTRDLTMLLRGDTEQAHDNNFELTELTSRTFDWHYGASGELMWKALAIPRAAIRRAPAIRPYSQSLLESTFQVMARMNVRRARTLLRPSRLLLTDRLHAAVLAALMKKPVVLLDNSYGKIAPIYAEYLHTLPSVHFARGVTEARQLVLQVHDELMSAGAAH